MTLIKKIFSLFSISIILSCSPQPEIRDTNTKELKPKFYFLSPSIHFTKQVDSCISSYITRATKTAKGVKKGIFFMFYHEYTTGEVKVVLNKVICKEDIMKYPSNFYLNYDSNMIMLFTGIEAIIQYEMKLDDIPKEILTLTKSCPQVFDPNYTEYVIRPDGSVSINHLDWHPFLIKK